MLVVIVPTTSKTHTGTGNYDGGRTLTRAADPEESRSLPPRGQHRRRRCHHAWREPLCRITIAVTRTTVMSDRWRVFVAPNWRLSYVTIAVTTTAAKGEQTHRDFRWKRITNNTRRRTRDSRIRRKVDRSRQVNMTANEKRPRD